MKLAESPPIFHFGKEELIKWDWVLIAAGSDDNNFEAHTLSLLFITTGILPQLLLLSEYTRTKKWINVNMALCAIFDWGEE